MGERLAVGGGVRVDGGLHPQDVARQTVLGGVGGLERPLQPFP